MSSIQDKILITDIGSTTTKTLLLDFVDGNYRFSNYATADTTVEKPYEDVKIGIFNSLRKLEAKTGISVITSDSTVDRFTISEGYTYLCTSSAGGGLQILAIGLTLHESARSAERAIYGVGGVLLATMAMNDGMSSIQRLNAMNIVRPDIVLFCGGTDDGALFSIYRLTEILKIADIYQKFSDKLKLPLVYAGNKVAIDYVKTVLSEKFDLYIVNNLRPTISKENLSPTKDIIHELFMNNVMEQAPGYIHVKKLVDSSIIPTPAAVLKTVQLLGSQHDCLIVFDIGGATTDVFTNISGHYNRSVSANYGMSYSIGNVIAHVDFDSDIMPYVYDLQSSLLKNITISKEYVLNYIGNKVLYPVSNPNNNIDIFIEHIVAIMAIKMSIKQHLEMNFKRKNDTIIQKIANIFIKKSKNIQNHIWEGVGSSNHVKFKMSDIKLAIGAGGVISNATNIQAIFILIESIKPEGITELWRDRHFISPHLGVLSNLDTDVAKYLIHNVCYEKLALYLHIYKQNIAVTIKCDEKEHEYEVKKNDLFAITFEKPYKAIIKTQEFNIDAGTYLIIDTRDLNAQNARRVILDRLKAYNYVGNAHPNPVGNAFIRSEFSMGSHSEPGTNKCVPYRIEYSDHLIRFTMPHDGNIYFNIGDTVEPDSLIGEIRFDPPRINLILISSLLKRTFSVKEIREGLTVKINDKVEMDDKIFDTGKVRYILKIIHKSLVAEAKQIEEIELTEQDLESGILDKIKADNEKLFSVSPMYELNRLEEIVYSPVRGIIERVEYASGTIVIKEIQDYPLEPVSIDIANLLLVKPENVLGYMKKKKGDFVYSGEPLASKHEPVMIISEFIDYSQVIKDNNKHITSPYTGTIQDIDTNTGVLTICYDKKPYQIFSMCYGKIESIKNNKDIYIRVNAQRIEGKIGFGKDACGRFIVMTSSIDYESSSLKGSIVFINHVTYSNLKAFEKLGVNGVVCNTCNYLCLKKYLKKDFGVALTGDENIPFSIIILKNFSENANDEDETIFNLEMMQHAMIRPFTQIRAGAKRPSLYLGNAPNSVGNAFIRS